MLQDALSRLARAWPVVAVVDGLFATALGILFHESTATLLRSPRLRRLVTTARGGRTRRAALRPAATAA